MIGEDEGVVREVLLCARSDVGGGGERHHLTTETNQDVEEVISIKEQASILQANLVEVQVSRTIIIRAIIIRASLLVDPIRPIVRRPCYLLDV